MKNHLTDNPVCHSEFRYELSGRRISKFRLGKILRCAQNDRSHRSGAALIVVLGIVMVVTVLALAYISRSDAELQFGQNMLLRTKIDYLAESALEHAKGLILNPQEVSGDYWSGANEQQIEDGDFYYDVTVEPNPDSSGFNYNINCQAYRLNNGRRTAQSNLLAQLRLDPCIAYYSGTSDYRQISSGMTINGDVYCGDELVNYGSIDGDVFCDNFDNKGDDITGRGKNCNELSLDWPAIDGNDFLNNYSAQVQTIGSLEIGPYSDSGICHRNGDLEINGGVVITGMLLVEGDLSVSGTGNTIKADPNLPAMYVTGDVTIGQGAEIDIEGLAVVDGMIYINISAGDVNVLGGVFAGDGIVETTSSTDGQNAIIHGEPSSVAGGGMLFDGSDDFIQTENNSDQLQLTDDYTLSVRIKADAVQNKWAGILSKTDSGGTINHWTLQFDYSSSRKLVVCCYDPSYPDMWETGITLNDIKDDWHHIAVTRNGNTMTFYLDGEEKKSGTWLSNPNSGYGHLNIGTDRTGSDSYTYKGLIDDVRVYDSWLDVNDILILEAGGDVAGSIAHWNLDEDGGRSVAITAVPSRTAIWYWAAGGDRKKWSQAADAFYKVIRRN